MPLTMHGIAYLFALVASALAVSYLIIMIIGTTNANLQYNIAISTIFLFIGLFFTEKDVRIGLDARAIWSFILTTIFFLVLYAIDLI